MDLPSLMQQLINNDPQLERVTIEDLHFRSVSGRTILNALSLNTIVTELSIYHQDYIGDYYSFDREVDREAGVALAELLTRNTTLTSLKLQRLPNTVAIHFLPVLYHNTALTSLQLSNNKFHVETGLAIAKVLEHNTTLLSLNMSSNYFGEQVGIAVAGALEQNTTLTSLNLADTSLWNKGALVLIHALKVNTTLLSLDISNNGLDDLTGWSIGLMLEENTTLTDLGIWRQRFEQTTLYNIKRLMDGRKTTQLPFIKSAVASQPRSV